MRILIAPNSFKNSLSSVQITEILSNELLKLKNAKIIQAPVSDGGDGFIEVLEFYKKKSSMKLFYDIKFKDHLIKTVTLFDESTKTIYIESANIIGLKLLKKEELDPFNLNSFPIGEIIKILLLQEKENKIPIFDNIVIGVGGTSTLDLGLGAMNALGVSFCEENGDEIIPIPKNFNNIKKIHLQELNKNHLSKSLKNKNIFCVVDVETKLIGKNNAIETYGPQKGLVENDFDKIISGIENVLKILKKNYIFDEASLNGAGGGLASGFNIFLEAKLISSKEFIMNQLLKLNDIDLPDFVITAEGKFDSQSFEGKATGEIIKEYSSKVQKIFVVCGLAENDITKILPNNVEVIKMCNFFSSVDDTIKNSSEGLKIAAEIIHKQLFDFSF